MIVITSICKNLIEFLENYEHHHRLGVFYREGLSCVSCGITGNNIKLWYDRNPKPELGGLHIDLFCDEILMTVDHILPRSRGGNDAFVNKQPMCSPCNSKKGDTLSENDKAILMQNGLYQHIVHQKNRK